MQGYSLGLLKFEDIKDKIVETNRNKRMLTNTLYLEYVSYSQLAQTNHHMN
jgi:hypothetical protein